MRLYQIRVRHYAQKGSHESIETYVVAEDGEQVYLWIKSSPELFVDWEDREECNETFTIYAEDSFTGIGEESFKERILRLGGEINDEYKELDDLYYGVELYAWVDLGEILPEQIRVLRLFNIISEEHI